MFTNPTLFFIFATLIAAPGITFATIKCLESIFENPENRGQFQTKLFIQTALFESIPIVLIVFGFVAMDSLKSPIDAMTPLVIVIATVIICFNLIFLRGQKLIKSKNELKETLTTTTFIGIALMNAVPIVSIVALLMMNHV